MKDIAETTSPTRSDRVKVPGATIYYEVRGSGPLLVMIPGGPTDAGIFAGVAGCLAERFTVVAYDPRGNSRSTFDGTPEEQDLDVHGDDAAQLIAALGDGSAYVFGNSGGAQIGLNLAARHPERVRTLVAHEPPCVGLLHDASARLDAIQDVYDTYRRAGTGPAMQKFMELAGMGGAPEPGPEAAEMFARIGGNLDYFFAHGLRPLSSYVPDVDALRAGSARVVAGIGETTRGQIAHRSAVALAQKLGTEPVTFPGDHSGFVSHPDSFATTLHRLFGGE